MTMKKEKQSISEQNSIRNEKQTKRTQRPVERANSKPNKLYQKNFNFFDYIFHRIYRNFVRLV